MAKNKNQKDTLNFHSTAEVPFHRLPFVGRVHTQGSSLSYWDVPATGGYVGGLKTGAAIAQMYLKHSREMRDVNDEGRLFEILSALVKRLSTGEKGAHALTLRGQMHGFLYTIEAVVAAGVRNRGEDLDNLDWIDLLRSANEGVSFDETGYITYLDQIEQTQADVGAAESGGNRSLPAPACWST